MVNGKALSVPEMPSAPSSGFLNTLHEYAAPTDRWMDRAAGGTSQRLHPGGATMRARLKNVAVDVDVMLGLSWSPGARAATASDLPGRRPGNA
ncbi:uncharacterized protein RMCC_2005 [Mycolicibacterium canariasense]|uniref:Uncharacterized protein n=1 Tax=Mycolicibacterium canariasense TaxID=228230 RepID=A0A100WAX4_MYCCR|nr:uncharacterized protein RMCC_2005 [Mycolicibacterium canariasense]